MLSTQKCSSNNQVSIWGFTVSYSTGDFQQLVSAWITLSFRHFRKPSVFIFIGGITIKREYSCDLRRGTVCESLYQNSIAYTGLCPRLIWVCLIATLRPLKASLYLCFDHSVRSSGNSIEGQRIPSSISSWVACWGMCIFVTWTDVFTIHPDVPLLWL